MYFLKSFFFFLHQNLEKTCNKNGNRKFQPVFGSNSNQNLVKMYSTHIKSFSWNGFHWQKCLRCKSFSFLATSKYPNVFECVIANGGSCLNGGMSSLNWPCLLTLSLLLFCPPPLYLMWLCHSMWSCLSELFFTIFGFEKKK